MIVHSFLESLLKFMYFLFLQVIILEMNETGEKTHYCFNIYNGCVFAFIL